MDFLLKIGKGKYIKEIYENEYLFFNSFSSFRSNEKDPCGRVRHERIEKLIYNCMLISKVDLFNINLFKTIYLIRRWSNSTPYFYVSKIEACERKIKLSL